MSSINKKYYFLYILKTFNVVCDKTNEVSD